MLPTLHASSNRREHKAVWQYVWGALKSHPAAQSCVHKWNATMQSAGNDSAYMPSTMLDIRYEDVPTQVLEALAPPPRTDCNDKFITSRVGMVTGAMFRALAKRLYGDLLLGEPNAATLAQRFAVPRVQTKWSKTFKTGDPMARVGQVTVTHSIIDTKKVREKVNIRVGNKVAFNHGTLCGWELFSHMGCVWLRGPKAKTPAYPSFNNMGDNRPDALIKGDGSTHHVSAPGGTHTGDSPANETSITAKNICDTVKIPISSTTQRVPDVTASLALYLEQLYVASDKSLASPALQEQTETSATEGMNHIVRSPGFSTHAALTANQKQKFSDLHLHMNWRQAITNFASELDKNKQVTLHSEIILKFVNLSTGSSMSDATPAEFVGVDFADHDRYVYVSFPASESDKKTTGSKFYQLHLYSGLRQTPSRGAAEFCGDLDVSASSYVNTYGTEASTLQQNIEEGNQWWNDTVTSGAGRD